MDDCDGLKAADVFPLPLSPFEKFILWDETPTQPMTSFIELHFESELDIELLGRAISTAVHRNPLLASRVTQRDGELVWEYEPSYQPVLRSTASDPPLQHGWPVPIDLNRECGSRFWYGVTAQGSRLMVQLHHACCDGMGLRRVLIDVLTSYARAHQDDTSGGETARWENLSMQSLVHRFDFSKSFQGPPTVALTTWQRIKNAHYFHFQTPRALSGNPATTEELSRTDAREPLRHCILSRELSSAIVERAKQRGVGVNEIALALLFQTCCRWEQLSATGRSVSTAGNQRLRILMPYDLRSRIDLRMPATNRLSFAFLGRNFNDCADLDCLIVSLQDEIQRIKDSRLPLDFLAGLQLAARRPWLLRWALSRNRNMATTVLTYTGDVSRGLKKYLPEKDGARMVGDVRLTNIFVAPPVRDNTNISLGLCINWGQLCISAAWNRAAVSADDCEAFLKLYAVGWSEWING